MIRHPTTDRPRQGGYLAVLRQREFGLLWVADLQSLLGDQLARVALAVLVYDRTGSGFATAAVYSLTFAVGGVAVAASAAIPARCSGSRRPSDRVCVRVGHIGGVPLRQDVGRT